MAFHPPKRPAHGFVTTLARWAARYLTELVSQIPKMIQDVHVPQATKGIRIDQATRHRL